MKRLKIFLTIACDKEVVIKALKVAFVVGFILNFINQGDKFVAMDFENINYFKFFLTFIVPFLVSSYTATSLKLQFKIGDISPIDVDLKCKHCKNNIHIKKFDTVPMCQNCQENTLWRI